MKNDLDLIRDKIENSGVKAPAEMDEAFFAEKLENVYPQPVPLEEKPKKKRRIMPAVLSATAAVLVVSIALGVILNVRFKGNKNIAEELPGGLALHQFQSYDEVKSELARLERENDRSGFRLSDLFRAGAYDEAAAYDSEAAYDVGNGSSGAKSSDSSSHSETYTQVEGVDEADIIKTDGRFIYCVDNSYSSGCKISVFAADGKDPSKAAEIRVYDDLSGATYDEADRWEYSYSYKYRSIIDMYLSSDRLVVLCDDYDDSYSDMTRAVVYDISDIGSIKLLDTFAQTGSYDSSRMIGDKLYLVSSYYPYDDDMIPVCGRGMEPERIPADCIYSLADNETEKFLVVSGYDTRDYTAQTESKTILGAVDDLYCNESNMYICSTVWEKTSDVPGWYSKWIDDYAYVSSGSTRILKVDLTDGVSFTAYAEVDGQIDDQYALDEYNGNLRVATTSTKDGTDVNNIFVLDEDLSVIGSVTGFAEDESIKAVRYLGDTAYVITYEQTDPLFVIDLSEPTAPAILGEVKISGFSTMLVPIDENTLLGMGYHTENEDYTTMEVQEGFKLALFDISDKSAPKVLDSKSYVDCSSVVQYNPKGLVYNPDRGDYIIPLNYCHWDYDDYSEYYNEPESNGGVLDFTVENGKLVEIGRYRADYDEVERCVYVGDDIYMTYYGDDGEICLDSVPYPDAR